MVSTKSQPKVTSVKKPVLQVGSYDTFGFNSDIKNFTDLAATTKMADI